MSNFIYGTFTLLAIFLTVYRGLAQRKIWEFILGVIIFWFITLPWIMNLIEKEKN